MKVLCCLCFVYMDVEEFLINMNEVGVVNFGLDFCEVVLFVLIEFIIDFVLV